MTPEHLGSMTADELDSTFRQLVSVLHVAHAHALAVIAEIGRRSTVADDGASSLGAWVAAEAGLLRATGEKWARTAERLETLPCLATAFERGSISFDQVAEVARFATPDTDLELAESAPYTSAAALRATARDAERITRDREDEEDAQSRVRSWRTKDGRGTRLDITLFGELDEKVMSELGRLAARVPKQPDGTYLPIEHRMAAALGELAGASIVSDDPDRANITIYADHEFVVSAGEVGVARFGSGRGISPNRLEELACDCRVQMAAVDPAGQPTGLSSTARSVPPWLRRQVLRRDRFCTFPGCEREQHLHIHHMVHWMHGGPTESTNLAAVCSFHHRLLHSGWNLRLSADGSPAWLRPDGRRYQPHPDPLHPRLDRFLFGQPEAAA